ncbi:MAG: hypothetical protein WCD13_02465 [Pseudolabrys sp.]
MTGQMIESIMYFGIGFLLAALSVLVVAPLVHGRAERLTMRRLEATIPLSMAEVQADKDLQRAEFAMSTRRLEMKVERLRTNSTGQLAELGRKGDAINRLKVELGTLRDQLSATEEQFAVKTRAALDAQHALSGKESELAKLISEPDERSRVANVQKVEIIALKAQVEAFKQRFTAAGRKVKPERGTVPLMPRVPMDSSQSAPNNRHHEGDVVTLGPNDWPTAALLKVPMDSSQSPPPNEQCHDGGVVPPVKVGVVSLMPKVPIDSSPSPPQNAQRHEAHVVPIVPKDRKEARSSGAAHDPIAGRDASGQYIQMVRERSDFSAGLRAAEPSIRVFPRPSGFKNDQFANDRSPGRRPFRAVARLSIAALIGVGGLSAWQSHGDEAMEKFRTWGPSLGWLSSVSTTKSPPAPAPAAAATSPEFVRQLEAMPRDLAVVRRNVEELTEKHEQMARNIASLQTAEHHIKKKTLSPHLHEEKLTPWPETPPATIPGWTLRGITNGTAVLEGPNGIWKAMRGDTVPGVGRVESMVRWGRRLIVATSSGLISTP